MKVLAIDQSYTYSGVVLLENKELNFFEVLSTDKQFDTFQRALQISQRILDLTNYYKPDMISLEGLSFGGIGNASRNLAGLQYSIITLLYNNNFNNIKIIAPKTVKLKATGNGKAKKLDMLNALPEDVKNSFISGGFKKSTGLYDLADAYFIAKISYDL